MKTLGILFIMIGFLGGALFAVLRVEGLVWGPYIGAMVIGVIGVVLLKSTHRAGAKDETRVSGNLETLATSLGNIKRELDELCADTDRIPPHEYRFEIDRRFREDLTNFANARESMEHAFGLQTYADIMSAFAAGERYINRVWTASTDGYVDEVMTYLEKARKQFDEALEDFQRHYRKAETPTR